MNIQPKGKYWAFVGYEESLPSDYVDILNLTGLAWARSPYHNKDTNADGSLKKSHWHFIICWNGPTTLNAVKRLVVDRLNCPQPIMLESPKGYYNYFTHKDNPEKVQYDEREIFKGNSFDLSDYFNGAEITAIVKEISTLILDSCIPEYAAVSSLLLTSYPPEYFNVLSTHTIHFNALCRSVRHSMGATTTAPIGD